MQKKTKTSVWAIIVICIIYSGIYINASDSNDINKPFSSHLKIKKPLKDLQVPYDVPFFDIDGAKLYLDKYDGMPLILTFWASWCAPCAKEIPTLDTLKRDFSKLPVAIIAISEDFGGVASIKSFFSDNEVRSLEIFHDNSNLLFNSMGLSGLPTTFFIDSSGRVKIRVDGAINWNRDDMRQLIIDHMGGDFSLPRNTSKEISLNQTIKIPAAENHVLNKAAEKPVAEETSQSEVDTK
ncbi:MAG: TlpA disulfide reductase family protein [Rickettsiaceae bacterium]|nr:TlpA disulfide reductase family protein [Rickettsiaceae bacterium]